MECCNKNPNLPELSDAAKKELDLLPKDTLLAFENFYASTHAESMAVVDEETWDAILGSFIHRTPIRYQS